jgi:L-rhamnose mutarotase
MKRTQIVTALAASLFVLLLAVSLMSVAGAPAQTAKPAASAARKTAIRKAFVMSVNAGQEAEYARRHQPIWPELEATLKQHGVVTYSIFLEPDTRKLFAYVEFADQAQWDAVANTDICKRWWAYMKDIMPSNPDNSPVSKEIREIFHIEK